MKYQMNPHPISMDDPTSWMERKMTEAPTVLDVRVVTGTGGGPDKTILNSPRFLTPAYRMLCAYMHPPGDPGFEVLRRKAEERNAPLLSVPDRGPWDGSVLLQLLRICRRERVAIWHGHDYKSNLIGLFLRRLWPMRLVTTVHGWVQQTSRTPLYYAIDRFCLPRYDCVICVSDDLHQKCLACGVPEAQSTLIENGIDLREYSRNLNRSEAKLRLGIQPERLVIGAVGRLSEEKGFDLLIRSVDRLLKDGHDVELMIAGEGDHRPELEALISELGHQERFHLLGYRPDPAALYEAMDIYALSSRREGLPNVLLEAMAMDVPVIATRVAGTPRLIQHGENGLLVEPGSIEDLTRALSGLLRDNDLQVSLSRRGRYTIKRNYSFEVRMAKIAAIYDELLGKDEILSPRQDPLAP